MPQETTKLDEDYPGPVLTAEELEEKYEQITEFITDIVDRAGADGVVMGLSGGIDSTTTAYLAVEALGAENVHGLVMPGEVNSDENMSNAERVAEDLGIEYDVLEVEPIFDAITSTYPEAADDKIAAGNVRVRIRAVLNYYVANYETRVVLGTGNRSEALVGYFTKYGDGAVDCHPIGNLYKCQVRQLARRLGVPEDLVMQTPSAEMWEGQTDEDELQIDYDTLDVILSKYIDDAHTVGETATAAGVDPDVVMDVIGRMEASKHKRKVPPTP